MKKTIRNILLVALAMVLVATASIFGTIAYLQDEEGVVNVMTLGNVYIDQNEYEYNKDGELVAFTQGKPLLPYVGEMGWTNNQTANGAWRQFTMSNVVDKYVTVKNTGSTGAYVRTIFAFEKGDLTVAEFDKYIGLAINSYNGSEYKFPGAWKWDLDINYVAEIEGNEYVIFVATYQDILAKGVETIPSLLQVYLDKTANNAQVNAIDGNGNGLYDILAYSQAVQSTGFDNAEQALNAAFGKLENTTEGINNLPWYASTYEAPTFVSDDEALNEAVANGEDTILLDDVTYQGSQCVYGVGDTQVNGGVLDGNGKTLNVTAPAEPNNKGKYDYTAVSTTGGTIKNLTIEAGFRGIFLQNMTEDVYLDNIKLGGDEVCYCINTGVNDGNYSLYVTNSVINGWSSFAQIKSASFTNCTFGQGGYYTNEDGRLLKPYVNTTIENCSFIDNYYLDLSSLEAGCKVTIRNCTVNGAALTADVVYSSTVWTEFEGKTFFVELPDDGRTLSDCVEFE